MTWGFLYLAVLIVGVTLAVVGGLIRRLLHPTELCDGVVHPSHEHWAAMRTPMTDLVVFFLVVFGTTTFTIHLATISGPVHELAIGAGAGLLGALVLRLAQRRGQRRPDEMAKECQEEGVVTRDIPVDGYGEVEVEVHGTTIRLAARSACADLVRSGTRVCVTDHLGSVVVISPLGRG